jgi:hypothetical protein
MFKAHVLTVAMRQKTNHTKENIVDKFFDQNKGNGCDFHIVTRLPKELKAAMMVINLDQKKGIDWFFDFGTFKHVTKETSFFKRLEKSIDASIVKFTGGYTHVICGKGEITFFHNGAIKHVQDVLYVPNIHKNLLD